MQSTTKVFLGGMAVMMLMLKPDVGAAVVKTAANGMATIANAMVDATSRERVSSNDEKLSELVDLIKKQTEIKPIPEVKEEILIPTPKENAKASTPNEEEITTEQFDKEFKERGSMKPAVYSRRI